jgi:lysophospholipase L1-like esterase
MLFLNRLHLLFALLLALSAAATAEPIVVWPVPTPPAGTPAACFPLPRLDWVRSLQDHIDRSRKVPVDLLFDGDSITEFWQHKDAGQPVWQERYAPLNAFDFARSWDRVENMLWRVDHGQLDGLHPKLAVLQAGTYDMPQNSAEDVAAGIKLFVEDYRKHCPGTHILVLGLFPRAEKPADPLRAKIAQVNQIISRLDDGKNVTFLDIGTKFLQPDGTISREIMGDFLHPTEKGYQIWADAIQPVVDQYCPKSTASPLGTPMTSPPSAPPVQQATWPWPVPAPGAVVTTFPVPLLDWFERFTGNLAKLKKGPYELVFDGDSITDNWQTRGQDVWKSRYAAIKTADFAIGGDQVQHVLWRLQHGELAGQDPKLIMLMIGTNNGGQNAKDIAHGIRLVLNEYETRCPHAHILLLGIFPRGAEANNPNRAHIADINKILATYDDGRRVTFLDIGQKFLQPDGTLTADIMPDFLHPSAKGYQLWADAIQPVIDTYFPPPTTSAK